MRLNTRKQLKRLTDFAHTVAFGRPLRYARYHDGHIGHLRPTIEGAAYFGVEACNRRINRRQVRIFSNERVMICDLDDYAIVLVDDELAEKVREVVG